MFARNGGQASARNVGLDHATGRWVTFIDPDDFIAPDYFEQVERVMLAEKQMPAMVSCNIIFYYEQGKRKSDTHALRSQFANGKTAVDFSKPATHIQLSASAAFFDTAVIARNNLRFGENIKPTFEDANFLNRYLIHTVGRLSIFTPTAKYFYRKRSDAASTVDTSWEKEEHYSDLLEHGVLALMRSWIAHRGAVPVFVQRTALYQLMWYFKRLVNNDKRIAFLSDGQKARFVGLFRDIIAHIETSTIYTFDLAGIWFLHRVALVTTFKAEKPKYQIVYIQAVDFNRKLLKLSYFTGSAGFESFRFDGNEVRPVFSTSRVHTFAGTPLVEERIAWIPLRLHAQLTVMLECDDVRLSLNGKQSEFLSVTDIFAHFYSLRHARPKCETWFSGAVSRIARSTLVQTRYRLAWVLMDRDIQADDNAEHLYRYLRKKQPDVNAFFLLARSSRDWKRLKREGFRLVPFGSLRPKLLMLNCEHFISSHIDHYIVDAVSKKQFQLKHRFTFLQHGVISQDLSEWLNTKEMDCLLASAPCEYDSIANKGNRYKFSSREVCLTGMPRHDSLRVHAPPEKIILVMPTWRRSIAGATMAGSSLREINTNFSTSAYFREWSGLLQSGALSALARRFGYRIIFYPHLNVQPYGHLFELPDNTELITHTHGSIQDIFKRAALMITDYSSVSFEFGVMQRPVVYFLFDREEALGGAHTYQKGYFDYEADGFGPVCQHRDEVLHAVETLLQRDAQMAPEYRARAESFLPLRDGRNCERTFHAITALDVPAVARPATREEAFEALDQAVDAGKWSFVVERAAAIAERVDADHEDHIRAALCCSQAWRNLGDADAAQQALDALNIETPTHLATAIEYAEIASMQADWTTAAARWEAIVPQLAMNEHASRAHASRRLLTALYNAKRFSDAVNVALALIAKPDMGGDALPEYAHLGPIACELGKFEGARSLALCVLSSEQTPHDPAYTGPAYATLAALFNRAGDRLKASGMWMRALRATPDDATYAKAFDALADQYEAWSAEQWRYASIGSTIFFDLIRVTHACESSNELDVGLALAAMHRNMGELDAASQMVDVLRRKHASDAFVCLEAGELALATGDWARAEQHFDAAQAAPGGAWLSRAARGLLIARTELGTTGQQALAQAVLASHPDDIRVAHAFASDASREQRWEDACHGWSAVVELAQTDDATLRTHAILKSIEALREAKRLDEAQHLAAMLRIEAPADPALLRASAEIATLREDWTMAADAWRAVEENVTPLAERREASRRVAQALWWSGDRAGARARLWHETEATAFSALAAGDPALAARCMARLSAATVKPLHMPTRPARQHFRSKSMDTADITFGDGVNQATLDSALRSAGVSDACMEKNGAHEKPL